MKTLPTHGLLSLLAVRDFRFLVLSNALWWQSLFMEVIAIGWLVLDLTDSAWSVALVGFFRSAPFLLSGMFGGPLIDKIGRRRLIRCTQALAFLSYATLAVLIAIDQVALWHLYLLSFALGSGWSLEFPARRSLIPDLVSKEKTVDGLLLESTAQGFSRIIGPFLAGAIIDRFGAEGCFLFIMLLSGVALYCVLNITNDPIERLSRSAPEPAWRSIGQGFRYVGANPAILAVVLVTVIMNLLIFSYMSLLPVFARDILGQGATGLGLLGTGTGIGAFVGLYLINRLRRRYSAGQIFIVGTMGQCLGLVLFSVSTLFTLSWFLLFCAGVGQACFAILQSSIVLTTASDQMRSRAMSTVVLGIGIDPLGKIQTGLLAETYGAPFALGLQASMAFVLVGMVAIFLPEAHRVATKPKIIKLSP